ncbi:hypothetical protein HPB48_015667 [Haemaphysalis longicornis]|uniref:Uncharacterized protein n=1 Tax=Haemaphysalis longicornis TaxID=44386 RepID=A0A9J6FL91_HAELO|nr:hypothetical protein HPB48_015667 [Haemaphysalis longicornis]
MDGVIEQLLHRREAGTNGGGVLGTNGRLLHLVVLGARASAQQVAQAMRQVLPQGFRLDDKAQYALDFRIIDSDVAAAQLVPHGAPAPRLPVRVRQPAGAGVHPREPREDPAGQPGAGGPAALPRPAPGHGVCGPGGLPARGGHQRGPKACSAPSWTTAAAWTPCGWSRRCARWWRASSGGRAGFTSTRRCPRSRGPGRTCG